MNICLQAKFKHRPKFKRRKAQRQSSRLILELGTVNGKLATNFDLKSTITKSCIYALPQAARLYTVSLCYVNDFKTAK
jgi:hypothetical protein